MMTYRGARWRAWRQLLIIILALAAPAARAQSTLLSGMIGKAPVVVSLSNDKGRLSGWYVYLRVGRLIRLEGALKAGGAYTLDEFPEDAAKSKKTGFFAGTAVRGHWTGTWRKPEGGGEAAVDLSENHSTLAGADINLQCAATRPGTSSGNGYTYSLALAMTKGAVHRFSLAQRPTRPGADQGCAIGLKDLKPVRSGDGLLLQTGDLADDGTPRCTIRLAEAGDYLYVQVGDLNSANNDCRGGDEVMYCGLREDWADMIVDRKASTCRPVR